MNALNIILLFTYLWPIYKKTEFDLQALKQSKVLIFCSTDANLSLAFGRLTVQILARRLVILRSFSILAVSPKNTESVRKRSIFSSSLITLSLYATQSELLAASYSKTAYTNNNTELLISRTVTHYVPNLWPLNQALVSIYDEYKCYKLLSLFVVMA